MRKEESLNNDGTHLYLVKDPVSELEGDEVLFPPVPCPVNESHPVVGWGRGSLSEE